MNDNFACRVFERWIAIDFPFEMRDAVVLFTISNIKLFVNEYKSHNNLEIISINVDEVNEIDIM